jgi:RNA polymerase sigma-70 factor (ECF subfamily)
MAIGARFPEVLLAARHGAEWAWAEIYRDLGPGVLRFLKGQGAADPEDCLGDCFLEVVRNLHRFEGEEDAFRAWVYTISRARLVDSWRRSSRRPRISGEALDAIDRTHHHPGADDDVVQQAWVADTLACLTPDQRSVLLLRVLHQFSVQETAAIIGKGEGAVKLLQHRAIRRLRRVLLDGSEQGQSEESWAVSLLPSLNRTEEA